jgi:tagatose 1,6-diphosphate aldolase
MVKLGAGKWWGMRRLADAGGRWKMIAIDQRTPLMQPIARLRGAAEADYSDVAAVKAVVTRHLAPHASAMLLDPNYAYPRCIAEMPPQVGLCLSLEHHVTEDGDGGRSSSTIPGWSVAKIRRIGGDAVKLLVWYRPDAHESVRERQRAFVRRVGAECAAHDVVLLLELLVYPLPSDPPGFAAANRARLVRESMRDFADPAYGVDIYKLEPPAPLADVPDPDGPDARGFQASYDELGALTTRPWVLLSAGASASDFRRSLTYAYRAGASGYLCGRAIWHDAFTRFPDLAAMERELAGGSVRYVGALNELTDRQATPWDRHPCWQGGPEPLADGPDFARQYPAG